MNLDLASIRHLANLSKLDLSADEETRLSQELGAILDMVDALRNAALPDASSDSPNAPLRADSAVAVDTREAAFAQAPSTQDGYFLVPRVIE